MKKFLPKSINNPQGFTLIELLVVVAIIAVLAVMGFAAFSGLTGRGNDDRRKADIKAISDAMEVVRGNYSAYQYLTVNAFAGGVVPYEPITGRVPQYAYTDGTAAISNPTAWLTTSATPTTGAGGNGTGWMPIGKTILPTVSGTNCATIPTNCTPTYYKVCALLEDKTTIICSGSRQ